MHENIASSRASLRRGGYLWLTVFPVVAGAVAMLVVTQSAVLAGSAVTNVGLGIISGNLGVSPGVAVTRVPSRHR